MRRRERRKAGKTEPRAGKSREERGANTALPPWARAPDEPRPPLERRHRHGLAQGPTGVADLPRTGSQTGSRRAERRSARQEAAGRHVETETEDSALVPNDDDVSRANAEKTLL